MVSFLFPVHRGQAYSRDAAVVALRQGPAPARLHAAEEHKARACATRVAVWASRAVSLSVSLSFVRLAPLQAAGNAALQADPCDAARALEHYTRALALLCWFGAVPLTKGASHNLSSSSCTVLLCLREAE